MVTEAGSSCTKDLIPLYASATPSTHYRPGLAVVDGGLMVRDTPSTPWEASSWLRKRCSSPCRLGQLRDPSMPSLSLPETQAPKVRSWVLSPLPPLSDREESGGPIVTPAVEGRINSGA